MVDNAEFSMLNLPHTIATSLLSIPWYRLSVLSIVDLTAGEEFISLDFCLYCIDLTASNPALRLTRHTMEYKILSSPLNTLVLYFSSVRCYHKADLSSTSTVPKYQLSCSPISSSTRGLYPPPHNPYGLHWTPLDSSGFQCPICQAKLAGTMPSPVWSTGLPLDCKPLFRVQSQSSGLRVQSKSSGVQWIPLDYCL